MSMKREFRQALQEYLAEDVLLREGAQVETICGTFTLDFVAERTGRRVAFDFSDDRLTEWRDALILGAGAVRVVYNLSERSLRDHFDDTFWMLVQNESRFFTERAQQFLMRLASDDAHQHYRNSDDHILGINYVSTYERGQDPDFIQLLRREGGQERAFWHHIYQFAASSALTEGRCGLLEMRDRWEAAIEACNENMLAHPDRHFRGDL